MSDRLAKLKQEVQRLSSADAKKLLPFVQAQVQLGSKKATPTILESVLRQEYKRKMGAALHIPPSKRATFTLAVEAVDEQMREWLPELRHPQRLAFASLAAELVIKVVKNFKLSYQTKTQWRPVVVALSKFPELLEQAFPGYLGSGLLGVVIERRMAGGEGSLKQKRTRT